MQRRHGFTIVELLVALALILFIMAILSTAFSAGLETFRQLKAVGDMQERMRTVATIMRRDLRANVFEAGVGTPGGTTRLSGLDPRPSNLTYQPPNSGFFRLWRGTDHIDEGTDSDGNPSPRMSGPDTFLHFSIQLSGVRPENFLSAPITYVPLPAPPPTRQDGRTNPALYFLGPGALQIVPTQGVVPPPPPGTTCPFNTQTAEVVYFLSQASTGMTGTAINGAAGVPLFALCRRQILVPSQGDANRINTGTPTATRTPFPIPASPPAPPTVPQHDQDYFEVSCKQDPNSAASPPALYFNGPTDLTVPERRFGMDINASTTAPAGTPVLTSPFRYPTIGDQLAAASGPTLGQIGDDIILTNVVSFYVRILAPDVNSNDFVDIFGLTQDNTYFTGLGVHVFDTWTNKQVPGTGAPPPYRYDYSDWATSTTATRMPMRIRVTAVQIILRVWDEKTERTRQVTIVQNM